MGSPARSHSPEDDLLWDYPLHSSVILGILTHKLQPPQQPKSDLCLFYSARLLLCTWAHLPVPHIKKRSCSERQGKHAGHLTCFPYVKDHCPVLLSTAWEHLLCIFCYFHSCLWHKAKPNISYSSMSRSSNPHHFLICNTFIIQFKHF